MKVSFGSALSAVGLFVPALLISVTLFARAFAFFPTDKEHYEYLKQLFSSAYFITVNDWNEKEGVPDGVIKGYYSYGATKGQLAIDISFSNGKQNGPMRWYLDGKLSREMFYKSNKENGPSRTFDINGRLIDEMHYAAGIMVARWKYDQQGKPFDEWKLNSLLTEAYLLEVRGKTDDAIKSYENCYENSDDYRDYCGLILIDKYKDRQDYARAEQIVNSLIKKFGEVNASGLVEEFERLKNMGSGMVHTGRSPEGKH